MRGGEVAIGSEAIGGGGNDALDELDSAGVGGVHKAHTVAIASLHDRTSSPRMARAYARMHTGWTIAARRCFTRRCSGAHRRGADRLRSDTVAAPADVEASRCLPFRADLAGWLAADPFHPSVRRARVLRAHSAR
jgi:hypothetical protein